MQNTTENHTRYKYIQGKPIGKSDVYVQLEQPNAIIEGAMITANAKFIAVSSS